VQGEFFSVLYRLDTGVEESSIGIVVRGKVGNAVLRNKLRRRIKAYLNQNNNKIPNKISAVILAKDNASEAGWQEINSDLDRCFTVIYHSLHSTLQEDK